MLLPPPFRKISGETLNAAYVKKALARSIALVARHCHNELCSLSESTVRADWPLDVPGQLQEKPSSKTSLHHLLVVE
jgi:hypothetical protein